jgi:hypothetical protein
MESMDDVIHSAPWRLWMKSSVDNNASCPLSYVESTDEVIYTASWSPWQKSAIVPAALLQRDWKNLSFSDKNIHLFCCIVAFAALLLFNQLTDFPFLFKFACAGGCEMDQDSSPKLMASLHEMYLKSRKYLQQPKRKQQPLQPPQWRRQRQWRPPAAASSKKPR